MKRLIRWVIIFGILALAGWGAYGPSAAYLKERNRINYREAEVTKGKIVAAVHSTGTVKPTQSVQVGSFISGPILAIYVDFNDEVKKGQLLAKIDPQIYTAAAARDKANLAMRKADMLRVDALLQQALNNEKRSLALRAENKNFISDQEMDQFKFARISLDADLEVAKTSIEVAQASLEKSLADLGYAEIKSPADGVIIDRKIDPGQTVAASFQTPELFVVAPDMRKEMRIFASVDETDIGLIRGAQEAGQPVRFTVEAYPDDLFEGTIFQIRKSSTTTQNVVTYPVIISAPNEDLKLLPGMTASISFQLKVTGSVLRIPNSALRFYPLRDQVRPEDRELLENKGPTAGEVEDGNETISSADEKAELRRKRNRRHVWIVDGDFLKAVPVVVGLSNNRSTELVSGELTEGQKLVTGVQTKK